MDQKVFSFNALKHHLLFVRQMIKFYSKEPGQNITLLADEIKQIGNNVMDLYTGSVTAADIIEQIESQLSRIGITDMKEYKKWLGYLGYKRIELADNSSWILRFGLNDEAYIHFHPARYGKHVTRLTGSAWKTALATVIFKNEISGQLNDIIDRINYVRMHYLELSPVKKIIPASSLDIALKLLETNLDTYIRTINPRGGICL